MIESKLPSVGTTIFTHMSALAQECGAINLSQGFPDFDPPPGLAEALGRAATSGQNQYAPMAGLPRLRAAVADQLARHRRRGTYPGDFELVRVCALTVAAFQDEIPGIDVGLLGNMVIGAHAIVERLE